METKMFRMNNRTRFVIPQKCTMMKMLCKPSKQLAGSILLTDMIACTSCGFQYIDLCSRMVPTVAVHQLYEGGSYHPSPNIARGPFGIIIVNYPGEPSAGGNRVQGGGENVYYGTPVNCIPLPT